MVNQRLRLEIKLEFQSIRQVFDKGYTPNWTEEIFIINKVLPTKPVIYNIVDLMGESIKASFYEQESKTADIRIEMLSDEIKEENGVGEMEWFS